MNSVYRVYGIGRSAEDVQYVGWTSHSMSEGEQIFSELVADCNREVAHWAQQALKAGEIDIFEIESASTVDEAKTSTAYWRDCFSWLGLNVISDRR